MGEFIYLDNAATTKTAPEAVEAMLPYFTDFYGNPSSIYSLGASAQKAVEDGCKGFDCFHVRGEEQ